MPSGPEHERSRKRRPGSGRDQRHGGSSGGPPRGEGRGRPAGPGGRGAPRAHGDGSRPAAPIPADPHPAQLPIDVLVQSCTFTTGRISGPGGQHRNKVETAVGVTHDPSGVQAQGTERRSQIQNRSVAIFRLRMKLARKVRRNVHPVRHQPCELWEQRRQGEKLPVNPKHADYPALLAEALDVINARAFDVAGAAGVLGITMSQLARLVRHDKAAFAQVNEGRTSRGLPALK